MILAVFARANHPKGYGMSEGTAHGYITVIVQCHGEARLAAVTERLGQAEWNGSRFDPWKRGDTWYAGPYELVWRAAVEQVTNERGMFDRDFPVGAAFSYGDNRACAYLTDEQVLEGETDGT